MPDISFWTGVITFFAGAGVGASVACLIYLFSDQEP
jgi:hypothetical protein